MADRDPPIGARRLKIAARVPENEISQGKPADWLLGMMVSIQCLLCLLFQLDAYVYKVSWWARHQSQLVAWLLF